MKTLRVYLVVLGAYMRVNWRSAIEYRINFIFDATLSLVEVAMYLFFWKLFFNISDGVPGATYEQLAALVAFNHAIYAGCDTLVGDKIWDTVQTIVKGQLDIFLVQPKSAIFQLFFSGANPMRALEVVVGTILFFTFVPPTLSSIALFLFGLIIGTTIFTSWVIAVNAITFRFGNAVVIYKLLSTILLFAKKPANIFSLGIRFILYTIIPAAFLGTVQVQQVFDPDPLDMLVLTLVAALFPFVAVAIFRRGLRRYESGNLIGVRI